MTLEYRKVVPKKIWQTRVFSPSPGVVVKLPRDKNLKADVYELKNCGHPAMMHTGLLLQLAEKYVSRDDVLLDPFGGSGTTALAEVVIPCKPIICELETHWAEVARAVIKKIQYPDIFENLQRSARPFLGHSAQSGLFDYQYPVRPKNAVVLNMDSSNLTLHHLDGVLADVIITSPPYWDTFGHPHANGKAYSNDLNSPNLARVRNRHFFRRGLTQVYKAALEVLKTNGTVVIVTKDVIRKGIRQPLALENIIILQSLCCELVDWWRREITPSFQVNRYRKRYPDAARVDHEDILVFKKRGEP